jgi:hypothetical protein
MGLRSRFTFNLPQMPVGPDGPPPTAVRLQFWFEQFRDLAVINLALDGGVITLLGTVFNDAPQRGRAFIGVALFGIAAITALLGQSHVVDLADHGQPPDKKLRFLRAFTFMLLGSGGGAFATFALRAFGIIGAR